MSKQGTVLNCRRAARWACDSIPVTWERDGRRRRRPGWLNDISSIGVGYITARAGAPRPGDQVSITPRHSADCIAGTVVRVTELGEGLCIVGCERLDTTECGVVVNPSPMRGHCRARISPHRQMAMAA